MSSVAPTVCGLRMPAGLVQRTRPTTSRTPSEAQRLTLPAGHYGSGSRQVSSTAFAGAFRHQQPAEPPFPSRFGDNPSFVRPDCPPSIMESVDETAGPPLDLEDVDMAKLFNTMKLKAGSKAPSRSALEQVRASRRGGPGEQARWRGTLPALLPQG